MTPRECLTFAAKMSSGNITEYEVNELVNTIIKNLRLKGCADTLIGGPMMKGISGGERKRTSIGYEMITKPSLLLLDEPTSGLDSHSALQVTKLLKNEVRKGMTILSTIHLPSSEIFHTFDRVIILSDGYVIYNGKTNQVINFL